MKQPSITLQNLPEQLDKVVNRLRDEQIPAAADALEHQLNGVYTTSGEFIAEVGSSLSKLLREHKKLMSRELQQEIDQCLRVMNNAYRGR